MHPSLLDHFISHYLLSDKEKAISCNNSPSIVKLPLDHFRNIGQYRLLKRFKGTDKVGIFFSLSYFVYRIIKLGSCSNDKYIKYIVL